MLLGFVIFFLYLLCCQRGDWLLPQPSFMRPAFIWMSGWWHSSDRVCWPPAQMLHLHILQNLKNIAEDQRYSQIYSSNHHVYCIWMYFQSIVFMHLLGKQYILLKYIAFMFWASWCNSVARQNFQLCCNTAAILCSSEVSCALNKNFWHYKTLEKKIHHHSKYLCWKN